MALLFAAGAWENKLASARAGSLGAVLAALVAGSLRGSWAADAEMNSVAEDRVRVPPANPRHANSQHVPVCRSVPKYLEY
eukprot:7824480-Pyramimonas_sp.AAC.1